MLSELVLPETLECCLKRGSARARRGLRRELQLMLAGSQLDGNQPGLLLCGMGFAVNSQPLRAAGRDAHRDLLIGDPKSGSGHAKLFPSASEKRCGVR